MNLIIDQGNTATKLAFFEEEKIIKKKTFAKSDQQGLMEYIAENTPKITGALISSVTANHIEIHDIETVYLNADTPLPVQLNYRTPQTLGKDRIANAVGAWVKNRNKNSLVIDLGTCIKYDLVNSKGAYLGGNISPGLHMRYKALDAFTDKLPLIAPRDFEYGYGTDTDSSILNGVQQGVFHEINGFINRYRKEFEPLTIFMTGGDLNFFEKDFKNSIFADSDLTMIGLNEILKHNVQNYK